MIIPIGLVSLTITRLPVQYISLVVYSIVRRDTPGLVETYHFTLPSCPYQERTISIIMGAPVWMQDLRLALVAFGCLCLVISMWNMKARDVVEKESNYYISVEQTINVNLSNNSNSTVRPPKRFAYSKRDVLTDGTNDMEIIYQCYGPLYDEFTNKLDDFCRKRIEQGLNPPTWGRPKSNQIKPNSNILFFGNSHTRQMAQAFFEQRRKDILNIEIVSPPWETRVNKERKFTMKNNVTVYVVTNSAIAHHAEWDKLLEDMMGGAPLESLDAIVMGIFNSCRLDKGTNYASEMMSQQGISCLVHEGPTVAAIGERYKGPLAMVTMFSTQRDDQHWDAKAMVEDLQAPPSNRKNVEYIYGRKYVEAIDVECAAAKGQENHDCSTDTSRDFFNLHRCVGRRGGHPDLIAWDVMEWLRENV